MSFERVCALSDLKDQEPLAVTAGDTEVAVIRTEGELFAIRDQCSHAAIALSEGEVEDCTVECWLHGSTFDLRTGKPTTLPATEPVAVYPIRVDGDDVLVDVTNPRTDLGRGVNEVSLETTGPEREKHL
jgi:3-phenylpropionate/trans-cinnamate dioxygenase ferredoxin component